MGDSLKRIICILVIINIFFNIIWGYNNIEEKVIIDRDDFKINNIEIDNENVLMNFIINDSNLPENKRIYYYSELYDSIELIPTNGVNYFQYEKNNEIKLSLKIAENNFFNTIFTKDISLQLGYIDFNVDSSALIYMGTIDENCWITMDNITMLSDNMYIAAPGQHVIHMKKGNNIESVTCTLMTGSIYTINDFPKAHPPNIWKNIGVSVLSIFAFILPSFHYKSEADRLNDYSCLPIEYMSLMLLAFISFITGIALNYYSCIHWISSYMSSRTINAKTISGLKVDESQYNPAKY